MQNSNTQSPVVPLSLLQETEEAYALSSQGVLPIIDLFNTTQRLTDAEHPDIAIQLYRIWLKRTDSPIAYAAQFNLGVALSNANDDVGAEEAYRAAIAQKSTFIEGHLNLATLLERTERAEEALITWRAVLTFVNLKVSTDCVFYVQALNNLGRLLEIRKELPEAEAMLARSLKQDPKQTGAMTHWVHLRQKLCEWPVYSNILGIPLKDMIAGTSALAMLSATDDPALQLRTASYYVEEKVLKDLSYLSSKQSYGHAHLRIGYLSSDFCSHAVSILTAELYGLHDRSKFEVYGFCWSDEDASPLRARVISGMDHHIKIGTLSDEAAANLIRSHEIDILVDLHGLTLGTRHNILSYRPAPVQITWLGFPGPTAIPEIDYVLCDAFVFPPELEPFFTEKPLRLPHTFQVNDRQRLIGVCPTKESCGLPEDVFVFCCFNNTYKITPEVFGAWMRILKRVPNSILWLVADNETVRKNLYQQAKNHGIPRNRLHFAERALPAAYLARFQVADLFLDTFPFGGGTTASDALWAGLPLLTYTGRTFASRMAGSLLNAVDLPELIAYNLQDYEDRAVELAEHPEQIAAMKQQLVDNRMSCALFDTPRFVRDLEGVLRQVAVNVEKTYNVVDLSGIEPSPEGTRSVMLQDETLSQQVIEQLTSSLPELAKPLAKPDLPLVSIVIPSYKPAHFEQCLKSAIGQTYPNIEILVSDNCPSDEIKDICKKYSNVIYQHCSVIRVDNVISALFSGKGKYVKPLFDDDILHPFCVERMVSVMMMQEDVELVFSASQVININNQRTEARRPYTVNGSLTADNMQRSMALEFRNFVGEFTSIMFKRQKIWNIGWRDLFKIAHHDFTRGLADVAFYCNVARGGSAFYIDEELSYFRRDQSLMSNSNISSNPDFGFCFSDYIDLAIVSHKTSLVSTEELVGLKDQVRGVVASLREVFYQMDDANDRYLNYIKDLELL
jgi:predicted O-linked N-acetylglucosamine transferase (SPINDLY family)/glycosyltransferase involved in cell wall biosynthesis